MKNLPIFIEFMGYGLKVQYLSFGTVFVLEVSDERSFDCRRFQANS